MSLKKQSRRTLLFLTLGVAGSLAAPLIVAAAAATSDDEALMRRFAHLNANGNSSCSRAFMDSIATMPAQARLQGSCCAPMDAHRYVEQIKALRAYREIGEIPGDPYDIEAGLARNLMARYKLELTPPQQAAYDYAMQNSDERGPCCCACWRWYVYGGLARQLISARGFDGTQITSVWNLSSGCGGGAEHRH